MADIELVIKIPKDVYTRLFDNGIQDNEIATDDICEMARALRRGTPLDEVIEDIKEEIADFMSEIPPLGNCKEGWHNSGQRIGLEQACEIIDNHISGKEQE